MQLLKGSYQLQYIGYSSTWQTLVSQPSDLGNTENLAEILTQRPTFALFVILILAYYVYIYLILPGIILCSFIAAYRSLIL